MKFTRTPFESSSSGVLLRLSSFLVFVEFTRFYAVFIVGIAHQPAKRKLIEFTLLIESKNFNLFAFVGGSCGPIFCFVLVQVLAGKFVIQVQKQFIAPFLYLSPSQFMWKKFFFLSTFFSRFSCLCRFLPLSLFDSSSLYRSVCLTTLGCSMPTRIYFPFLDTHFFPLAVFRSFLHLHFPHPGAFFMVRFNEINL